MVECGDKLDLLRQQHAVAEYVATHVTYADDRERIGLDIESLLPEMPPDCFPGAAGGNTHFLVVVSSRAPRRESIIEPVSVICRQAVCNIRECCRSFVGCHDEVGVVCIAAHDLSWRYDLAVNNVVSQIQQPGDEGLVACDAFGHHRLTITLR